MRSSLSALGERDLVRSTDFGARITRRPTQLRHIRQSLGAPRCPEGKMTNKKQNKIDPLSGEGTISSGAEQKQVEERLATGAHVVYETIRREGEDQLHRRAAALAWSAFAAGLSMGFSFIAEGILRAHLPDQPWRPLIASVGYCVGFLVVILGRQQPFTENTLTVVLPLLVRKDLITLLRMLRLLVCHPAETTAAMQHLERSLEYAPCRCAATATNVMGI
jgi:Formate/nitrite transporter